MNSRINPLRGTDPKNFQGWVLKGLIGEGGQSTVYLAEKDGHRAALKMIRKEFLHDETSVTRFSYEIKNWEILNHPNIARVIEVEDSGKFFAIEFIDGPNLEDYLNQSGPLPFVEWCIFAEHLASAINYCHSKGIIHKDVSPRNILISPKGPVLIDFGISYLEKDERLTLYETVGTPPYMSPEHFGMSASKEMDAFSLAGTLIFAATGHYPFAGETNSERRESILFGEPNFYGLSEKQILVLSPLLYKKVEDRGSLAKFSKLVKEIRSDPLSTFASIEFAKVKRESKKKLILEKKQLSVKNQAIKNSVTTAAIISITTIGLAASGILLLEKNSSEKEKISSVPVKKSPQNFAPNPISSQLSAPNAEKLNLGSSTQIDNSPNNKEIQANLDLSKKYYEANQLDRALNYAKLAANAGNAHGMYDVAYILSDQGKFQDAVVWYEKAASLGYGDAFWNLGALYEKLGKTKVALSWYEKGAKNNNVGSLNALGYYFGEKKGDYQKAISYYQKSADLGSLMGISNLGFAYEKINDKVNAKKWYIKASDLGSVDASVNVGYLYEQSADWTNARKYYKRAADKKDPLGMYNLALVLRNGFGQEEQGCNLLEEAALINSIEASTKELIDTAIGQNCSKVSATPIPSPKPSASSSTFKLSAPLAPDVQIDQIFGKAFKNDLNYWEIPLTNVEGAKVPAITAVQFRMIGYPDAGWLNVPYKLKTNETLGYVYAQVDDFLFAAIFKERNYCPEFRLAREESGRIVQIWNKGKPDCATDYNP